MTLQQDKQDKQARRLETLRKLQLEILKLFIDSICTAQLVVEVVHPRVNIFILVGLERQQFELTFNALRSLLKSICLRCSD